MSNETLNNSKKYDALKLFPHWRRRLSNFDSSLDFTWKGRMWRSVDHAFQGAKMWLVDEEKCNCFSIDSGVTP